VKFRIALRSDFSSRSPRPPTLPPFPFFATRYIHWSEADAFPFNLFRGWSELCLRVRSSAVILLSICFPPRVVGSFRVGQGSRHFGTDPMRSNFSPVWSPLTPLPCLHVSWLPSLVGRHSPRCLLLAIACTWSHVDFHCQSPLFTSSSCTVPHSLC